MESKVIVVGQKERVAAWVSSRLRRNCDWVNYEAIGLEQDGELVAGVIFDGYVAGARCCMHVAGEGKRRSEEHTSELQSLMRISYAVFCLKKKNTEHNNNQDLSRLQQTNKVTTATSNRD